MNMEKIVELSVKHNVSDLHLCDRHPPRWRRQGRLEAAPFAAVDIHALLAERLNTQQQQQWQACGQIDFALSTPGLQRLRASAFLHHDGVSLALRLLPDTCPTLDMLDVPAAIPELLRRDNGLILVTGATGSGKSTTLASWIARCNKQFASHIITIEDPIEYVFAHDKGLVHQCELSTHFGGYHDALTDIL